MSASSDTPKRTTFRRENEDQEMLESLSGLSIKGFQDWCAQILPLFSAAFNQEDSTEPNVNTPSSTNASLRTPPALKPSRVFLATPERPLYDTSHLVLTTELTSYPRSHNWFSEGRGLPPNAPLIKDLDSFTEGTGHGSFDFPLATGPDEGPVLPLIFHPTEKVEADNTVRHRSTPSLDLDSLPTPSNPTDAVLAWIESISPTAPPPPWELPTTAESPPKKRRRSFTQDSETDDRRFRAWSPTIDSHFVPQSPQAEDEDPELVVCRIEPDAPG